MGFGMMAYNKVNDILENGGAGSVDPGLVLSLGDSPVAEVEVNGMRYVKISNTFVDFNGVSRILAQEDGVEGEFPLEIVTVETYDSYSISRMILEGTFLATSSKDGDGQFGPGTWVWRADENNGMFRIEFPETIHPINPKFLPGEAVTGVIDLDECGITPVMMQLIASGGGTAKNPAKGIPNLCKPGRQYVFRFDMGEGIYLDLCPSYYHYNAADACWGVGFSTITDMTGTAIKVDGYLTQENIVIYVTPLG